MDKPTGTTARQLEVAVAAARAAEKVLMEQRGRVRVEYKADHRDLVTAADREAEAAVIDVLHGAFPEHGILGEESDEIPTRDGHRWLVDPLDGTTNYAQGLPLFATSIGLEKDGQLLVGVIHAPVLKETYTAVRGYGALCNGRPIHVSATDTLQQSLLVTGFAHDMGGGRRKNVARMDKLIRETRGVRMLGSAAINLAFVAAGLLEAYWAPNNEAWDVAGGALIVAEAGGKVTDMAGGPLDLYRPELLATNGLVHEQMMRELAAPENDEGNET